MLASGGILEHVVDTPWAHCQVELFGMTWTLMSSGIATMVLIGVFLVITLPLIARRQAVALNVALKTGQRKFTLSGSVLEIMVLFIRDQIAIPSLGKRAYEYLPFLLTLFVFVLGMNLMGLTPTEAITQWATNHKYPVGFTPTSILTVCMTLASLTLVMIVSHGLWRAAKHSKLPFPVALLLSPALWFIRLAPHVPGMIGKVLAIPLAGLELMGVIAKCFALMIRLFANMVAGHIMLAVLMMFVIQTLESTVQTAMDPTVPNEIHFFYVGPLCILGSVLVDLMELLVAGLQAYILTFLAAMFLGLYVEPSH